MPKQVRTYSIPSPERLRRLRAELLQSIPNKADTITVNEIEDYKKRKHDLIIGYYKQNLEARKSYAKKIFIMVSIWLGLMILIIIFQGVGSIKLSDSVLITLITTTTLNVITLFYFIIKNLFPDLSKTHKQSHSWRKQIPKKLRHHKR
jgi:hypothetical protein